MVNQQSRFPIYIHSLEKCDADEFLNTINFKIENKKKLSKKELLLISLLCFMKSEKNSDQLILKSAITITNIPDYNSEIAQFVKGVILLLCDKFVNDESLNRTISNLVGGNMKIVEDYAQRKVDEAKLEFQKELQAKDDELFAKDEELNAKYDEFKKSKQNVVINLDKEGFSISDIARLADVSLEFVSETLSK
jgi:hypothetical protein